MFDECFAGPVGTLIDGGYRPVFFWRVDFERWFQKTFGLHRPNRPGRKLGTGSLAGADELLLLEMARLIEGAPP
jgi:hypothetical protein